MANRTRDRLAQGIFRLFQPREVALEERRLEAGQRPSAGFLQRRGPVSFDIGRPDLAAQQAIVAEPREDRRRDAFGFARMKLP